jgi:hypothetical protein
MIKSDIYYYSSEVQAISARKRLIHLHGWTISQPFSVDGRWAITIIF